MIWFFRKFLRKFLWFVLWVPEYSFRIVPLGPREQSLKKKHTPELTEEILKEFRTIFMNVSKEVLIVFSFFWCSSGSASSEVYLEMFPSGTFSKNYYWIVPTWGNNSKPFFRMLLRNKLWTVSPRAFRS